MKNRIDKKEKHWLLTAFEKEESLNNRTNTAEFLDKEMTTSLGSYNKSISKKEQKNQDETNHYALAI